MKQALTTSMLSQQQAAELARISGQVSLYCDRAEHLEITEPADIRTAGTALRALAAEVALGRKIDLIEAYRQRLDLIERRHPFYPIDGYAAIDNVPTTRVTWQQLQILQWEHDRRYHPDVFGLSRYDQLRHYAFHLAKLAGAAADPDDSDFERRLPDVLLFGLKLATLTNEKLPADLVLEIG